GGRYTAEVLLFLRDSPLCVKPAGLPPAEEWMGPPPETIRNQAKPLTERTKVADAPLVEQRRPGIDRTTSRSNANFSNANIFPDPEDIILGPPRTSFASATSMRSNKLGEIEKSAKDAEPRDRPERFNFRTKTSDADIGSDRFKDNRTNNAFRRRGDADQDSEGWSTVKPRKSFGTEGAERFHGRMGGSDRTTGREDRRFRDRDDRDNGDRRSRNTDQTIREKDGEDADGSRWNGLSRNRTEPRLKENNEGAPLSQRERIDRAKSWRDRNPEEKPVDKHVDRPNDRAYDRRWDRDREHRVEREPEWLDEPAEERSQGHTAEDFQKFMEAMKASRAGPPKTHEGTAAEKPAVELVVEIEQKVASIPATESGPDKFFAAYGGGATLDLGSPAAEVKESSRPKTGKSSRFTSFFSAQDDTRGRTEPPTPGAVALPSNGMSPHAQQNDPDKEAFAVLLQKLQRQSFTPSAQPTQPQATPSFSEQSSTPAMTPGLAPRLTPGLAPGMQHAKSPLTSPEPFQQYGGERREDPRLRGPPQPHSIQDILSPRPMPPPSQPPPAPRPDQNLQDLLAQRQHGMSQGSGRLEQNPAPVNNNNAEFLMRLMQSARAAPEPLRTEQLMVRMPQPTKQVNPPSIQDRESDYHRERPAPQPHRQMRPQGAPGFFDEQQFHSPENDNRPQQPTQILQRPPPPGLDHHMSQFQMGGAPQMPPQRPMIPPPPGINIMNNPRNGPVPGMFPPNFPPGAFPPPPDSMVGPPGPGPRNMQGPPGFYGAIPPPGLQGYMPPLSMGGFQGPPDGG
ncbi:hypothetical protein CONLIGDRAFT_553180, partial [Coniochaeta ligniaria NRRL 30616]